MLPGSVIKGFDKRRLKGFLALLFLALAIPTAAVIWQAYGQLKWEAFHQYRALAEDLTGRVDAALIGVIANADARSFADYTFLNVTGDPAFNFVERSPLSAFPVTDDIPGALGYFQVDPDGYFSTPLLPQDTENAESFGIGEDEYAARQDLAQTIQSVLAQNRLVESRADVGLRRDLVLPGGEAKDDKLAGAKEQDEIAEDLANQARTGRLQLPSAAEPASAPVSRGLADEEAPAGSFADLDSADRAEIEEFSVASGGRQETDQTSYSQQVFDELRQRNVTLPATSPPAPAMSFEDAPAEEKPENERSNTIGKVADLNLNAELQKKSESVEREQELLEAERPYVPIRAKRREQIALPETATEADKQPIANVAGPTDLRINTFQSEVDPLDFSLLDSGHFVFFRNVWRDGERFIQGLLIEQDAFVNGAIETAFYDSSLSAMSNLIVGYQDDVIRFFPGPAQSSYPGSAGEMRGALLYSSRLSAPLDSLELIFSINALPQGPGARVLGWVTLVLAIVFVGGFITLYRLGLGQINLAQQQQDFVSAVSHELKTPLTSIRMYGEMLREGWADETKRQDYYEYIHDESERLTRMISNVLKLAKISRNEPDLVMKPVKVAELISNIESKLSNQVERSGFSLQFDRDPAADEIELNIDEDCFTQIVINLVDNAIKFSRDADNKTIVFGSQCRDRESLQFSVRDYGPGIPKDQLKKIFTLFYRSESELTRDTVGTGIGLAIVKQLTTAMQGKVDVINTQPGAEFRISFPVN